MKDMEQFQEIIGKLATIKSLTEKKNANEHALRLLFKYTGDKQIRDDISTKTNKLFQAWEDWSRSSQWKEEDGKRTPKDLDVAIDGLRTINACYEVLLDELDERPAAKPIELEAMRQTLDDMKTISASISHGIEVLLKKANCAGKPESTIDYDTAESIMRRICGDDAVGERTLRTWISIGRASKANLAVSFDDLMSIQSWTAWCELYRAKIRTRLRIREMLKDHHGSTLPDVYKDDPDVK